MSVRDNVLNLWHSKRPDIKSVAELERKINISNGLISQWDSSTPSTRSADKVARFFNVPLSEVLGTGTDKSVRIDPDEQSILTLFRKNTEGLSDDEKERFNSSLDKLMKAARDIIDDKNEQ